MTKWLIAAVAAGIMQAAAAQSDVADFFANLKTFSGDFSQTVVQDGSVVQLSDGTVKIKKPLKFFWDYHSPDKMQLLSDGDTFYHYDIDLAQVSAKPLVEVTGNALLQLLSDNGQLDKLFSVVALTKTGITENYPDKSATWQTVAEKFYQLTPSEKTDDNQANKIVVGLSTAGQLTVFYAEDAYGENNFVFANVVQNAKIDDKVFQFSVPDGVDVLGQ